MGPCRRGSVVANDLRVTVVESAHGLDLGWTLDRNQLRVDGDFDGIHTF